MLFLRVYALCNLSHNLSQTHLFHCKIYSIHVEDCAPNSDAFWWLDNVFLWKSYFPTKPKCTILFHNIPNKLISVKIWFLIYSWIGILCRFQTYLIWNHLAANQRNHEHQLSNIHRSIQVCSEVCMSAHMCVHVYRIHMQ